MEETRNHSSERTAVHTEELVYDGQTEQGIELEFVLPDYCPDIFRILKCSITPRISSYSVSGDGRLTIDGAAYIKVLYLAENSDEVYCSDQRSSFSKTIDTGRKNLPPEGVIVTLRPSSDYCNCRAVSSRRIDIRGAVSVHIRISAPLTTELPALPDGLEVRKRTIRCCGGTITAVRQFTVREEIDTGASGIGFILDSASVPKLNDLRVIADKAVVKGAVTVNALYGIYEPESSGCGNIEKMTADIPISVILDAAGINDEYLTVPRITVMNCELTPKTDSGIISCELLMECALRADKEEEAVIAVDAYSLDYETELTTAPLRINTRPRSVSESLSARSELSCGDGAISAVWDARAELGGISCRCGDGVLSLSGQLFSRAMGLTEDGKPFFTEKQEPFAQDIASAGVTPETAAEAAAEVTDAEFSIRSDGTLGLTAHIAFGAQLREPAAVDAVTSVTILDDKPKNRASDYALRICYIGGEPADCWSIAKKYNTTTEALMRENGVENEQTALSGMIVIPTI